MLLLKSRSLSYYVRAFTGNLRPVVSEKSKREINDKLAEFIVLDMRPVITAKGEGFKELTHGLEPGYAVPKREMVMHMANKKHLCQGRNVPVNKINSLHLNQ